MSMLVSFRGFLWKWNTKAPLRWRSSGWSLFRPVRMRWEPFCPTPRATMPVAKATWTSNRSVWRSSPASPHFHRFMCAPVRWGLPPWRPWIPMTRWASTTCQRFQSRSVWLTSVFAIRPLSTWSEWKLWKHIKYIFLGVCMFLFIFICIRDKIIKNISKTSISIHQGFIERAFTLLSHCSCESQKYPKAFQKAPRFCRFVSCRQWSCQGKMGCTQPKMWRRVCLGINKSVPFFAL